MHEKAIKIGNMSTFIEDNMQILILIKFFIVYFHHMKLYFQNYIKQSFYLFPFIFDYYKLIFLIY